jgi:hypothetical protein
MLDIYQFDSDYLGLIPTIPAADLGTNTIPVGFWRCADLTVPVFPVVVYPKLEEPPFPDAL